MPLVWQHFNQGEAVGYGECCLEGFSQPLGITGLYDDPIDYNLDAVFAFAIEIWRCIQFTNSAIDTGADESLRKQGA